MRESEADKSDLRFARAGEEVVVGAAFARDRMLGRLDLGRMGAMICEALVEDVECCEKCRFPGRKS